MAVAVTESLPNLKKSSVAKRAVAPEPCIYAASKAVGLQNPCFVMKRAESIYPVQTRSATEEFRGCAKHRSLT